MAHRLTRVLLLSSALVAVPVAAQADPISLGLAAAASAFSAAATGTAAGIAAGATFSAAVAGLSGAAIAASAIVGGALAGLSQLMQGDMSPGTPAPNAAIRQPSAVLPYVYGTCRVGGAARIYHANEGPDFIRRSLETVWVLAAAEITDVLEVWDGDQLMWSKAGGVQPDYIRDNGQAMLEVAVRLGAAGDTIPADLLTRLPDTLDAAGQADFIAHTAGKPYVYIRFASVGKFWPKGLPSSMWFKVRGHAVYDYRTETTGYSNNLALCAADYVSRAGGTVATYLDPDQVAAAANLCDEAVALDGGGTQPRYVISGPISSDAEPLAELQRIMRHSAGHAVWTGERLLLKPGAYEAPVASFGSDDFVRSLQLGAETVIEDHLDGVAGVFRSFQNGYNETSYPRLVLDDYNPANGDPRLMTLNLPLAVSDARAQRVALLTLRQTRRLRKVSFAVPLTATNASLTAGDRVSVALSPIGLDGVFEITKRHSVYEASNPRVEIEAVEDNPTFWSWASDQATAAPVSLSSNLRTGPLAPPTGVTATPGNRVEADGSVTTWLDVEWTASTDPRVDEYEVRWTQNGRERRARTTATERRIIDALGADPVSVSVVAISSLGLESQPADAAAPVTLTGDTTPPAVPPSGSIAPEMGGFAFSIVDPTDADYAALRLYEGASGAAFGACAAYADYPARPGGAPTTFRRAGVAANTARSYYVTALDTSGNESGPYGPMTATTLADLDTAAIQAEIDAVEVKADDALADAATAIADSGTSLALAQSIDGNFDSRVSSQIAVDTGLAARFDAVEAGANFIRKGDFLNTDPAPWEPVEGLVSVTGNATPSNWGGAARSLYISSTTGNPAIARDGPPRAGSHSGKSFIFSGYASAFGSAGGAQVGIATYDDADNLIAYYLETVRAPQQGAGAFEVVVVPGGNFSKWAPVVMSYFVSGQAVDASFAGLTLILADKDARSRIATMETTKVDDAGAVAAVNSELSANAGGAIANLSQLATVAADYDGKAASAYALRLTAGAFASSVELVAWDDIEGGGSALKLNADRLLVNGTVLTDLIQAEAASVIRTAQTASAVTLGTARTSRMNLFAPQLSGFYMTVIYGCDLIFRNTSGSDYGTQRVEFFIDDHNWTNTKRTTLVQPWQLAGRDQRQVVSIAASYPCSGTGNRQIIVATSCNTIANGSPQIFNQTLVAFLSKR